MRRALREAGFLVSKVQGFGGKREMTVASLRPGMGRRPPADSVADTVLVVGGGPAGAGVAQALALRGRPVTVLDPAFAEGLGASHRSEEHTSELQSLMRILYAVFCLKKKKKRDK